MTSSLFVFLRTGKKYDRDLKDVREDVDLVMKHCTDMLATYEEKDAAWFQSDQHYQVLAPQP